VSVPHDTEVGFGGFGRCAWGIVLSVQGSDNGLDVLEKGGVARQALGEGLQLDLVLRLAPVLQWRSTGVSALNYS
jgi:hypothetical protein